MTVGQHFVVWSLCSLLLKFLQLILPKLLVPHNCKTLNFVQFLTRTLSYLSEHNVCSGIHFLVDVAAKKLSNNFLCHH